MGLAPFCLSALLARAGAGHLAVLEFSIWPQIICVAQGREARRRRVCSCTASSPPSRPRHAPHIDSQRRAVDNVADGFQVAIVVRKGDALAMPHRPTARSPGCRCDGHWRHRCVHLIGTRGATAARRGQPENRIARIARIARISSLLHPATLIAPGPGISAAAGRRGEGWRRASLRSPCACSAALSAPACADQVLSTFEGPPAAVRVVDSCVYSRGHLLGKGVQSSSVQLLAATHRPPLLGSCHWSPAHNLPAAGWCSRCARHACRAGARLLLLHRAA